MPPNGIKIISLDAKFVQFSCSFVQLVSHSIQLRRHSRIGCTSKRNWDGFETSGRRPQQKFYFFKQIDFDRIITFCWSAKFVRLLVFFYTFECRRFILLWLFIVWRRRRRRTLNSFTVTLLPLRLRECMRECLHYTGDWMNLSIYSAVLSTFRISPRTSQ